MAGRSGWVRQVGKLVILALLVSVIAVWPARADVLAQAQPGHSLTFIENVGQFDEAVRFQLLGSRGGLWLTNEAIWVRVFEEAALKDPRAGGDSLPAAQRGVNLKLSFVGANPQPHLEPFNRLDTHISYFSGSDETLWRTDVPVWSGVRYVDLYPGIDLELTGDQGQLAPRLIVREPEMSAAGARQAEQLSDIRLNVEGATGVVTAGAGRLQLSTTVGQVSLPLFQLLSADQTPLPWPELQPTVSGTEVTAPFAPAMGLAGRVAIASASDLLYSTFLGGAGSLDTGTAIAVDETGHAYVTGLAYPGFPTTPGAFDTGIDGVYTDAFVAKLNPEGTGLIYATFLGGSDYDVGQGLAVDEAGQAYVAGYTTSADFPTTVGAVDRSLGGDSDAFVVNLNDIGTELTYATYLGGSGLDFGWGLAVDQAGQAYLTGYSQSADFPISTGAFDSTYLSGEAYVVKLNVEGTTLAYATFLGGSSADYAYDIAVDEAGQAYVTGYTLSPDFPLTPGAVDTSQVDAEAFVAKLSSEGSDLLYGTYLGGSHYETAQAIAVDAAGQAYVAGFTESGDFPTTPDSFDPACDDCDGGYPHLDAFVVKIAPLGDELIYSSFLGGSQPDFAYDLAVSSDGSAYLAGYTSSADFPTTPNAFDTSCEPR